MKKQLFTLFIVSLLFVGSAFAQSFGVKGAFNMVKIYGSDADGAKLMPAFNIGAYGDFAIAESFYIRPELNYAMKGSKGEEDTKLTIHYLEIPVTFQYKAALSDGSFILGAGPYMGIGLGGKAKAKDAGVEISKDIEFGNEEGKVKRMDFGGKFYAGYELPMGLGFGLETNLGLTELMKDNKVKNIGFGLFLSYRIK